MEQDIRFCRTSDGIRIAYAVTGAGYPLVWVHPWVGHLELSLELDDERQRLARMSQDFTLVRFDKRGTGLSQRGVSDHSWEARARDIEAVAAHLGLEKFAVHALSEGCIGAMQFAADHGDKVSHLILQGFQGELDKPTRNLLQAFLLIVKAHWGLGSQFMSDVMLGEKATPELRDWSNRLQREGATADELVAMVQASIDGAPGAAQVIERITCPTLLISARDDNIAPPESVRALAAALGGRYMSIEGSHVPNREQFEVAHAAIVEFVLGRQASPAERATPVRATPGAPPVTIMFTDMESSTATTQRLGDDAAQDLVRAHNEVVREALEHHSGKEIKHTGDGIMASFAAASSAVECAMAIQRELAGRADTPKVRIGINAGEPVAEDGDLFGTSVQLAARVCGHAESGQIVASNVVRELTAGKKYLFADLGDVEMRGFEDPVRLYEVRWRE